MQNINLEEILNKVQAKIRHQLIGAEILDQIALDGDPVSFRMIEKGMGLILTKNSSKNNQEFQIKFPKQCIVFAIPLKGEIIIESSIQDTKALIKSDNYAVMAYPFENWEIKTNLSKEAKLGFLCLTLQKVHELFDLDIQDKIEPSVIAQNYRVKTFLSKKLKSPAITIAMNQLMNPNVHHHFSRIYEKAKVLEILTLHMEQSNKRENAGNSCPVVNENLEEEKLRRVEKILKHNMSSPPSIPELAKMIGTNELKLKIGFKKLYGNTIYGYLIDHRMDTARGMLNKGNVQIKDVAYNVGYMNPSHFIAVFKKKYGLTPKKYLQQI